MVVQHDWGSEELQGVPDPNRPGVMERVGRELAAPLIGMEQLAGDVLPLPVYRDGKWIPRQQADAELQRENEKKIKASGGGTVERMAVDTLNPINWATMLLAPELRAAGVTERAIPPLIGGASAGIQPVDSKDTGDFRKQKLEQVTGGMVGGKVGDTVMHALGGAIAPVMGAGQRILHDLGVQMTPGQLAGGYPRRIEEALSSVPFIGNKVRRGENRSIDTFNRASVDQVLEPIGGRLPDHIATGRDAIGYAQGELSDAYERLLPNLRFRGTQRLADDMRTAMQDLHSFGPQYAREYLQQLRARVLNRMAPTGTMDGTTFKEVESELTYLQATYRASQDPGQRHMGRAFDDLLESLRSELEIQNPRYAGQLQSINRAYAMLSRVEGASMKRATPDGTFMPSDLLRDVRQNALRRGQRKRFARGEAQMQDVAEAGQGVLPRKLPDSGTTERALVGGTATAGALGLHHFGMAPSPWSLLAAVPPYLAYTEPAMRTFQRYFANVGPGRRAVGDAVSNAGALAAVPAGQAGGEVARGTEQGITPQ
jgi:hypothetical protein